MCAHKWEKDGILYWPRLMKKIDIDAVRSDANSEPSKNWLKMSCTLKKANILSFEDGLKYEEIFNDLNTEDEERYL